MSMLRQAVVALLLAGTTFAQAISGPKSVDQPVTIPAANIPLAGAVTLPTTPGPKPEAMVFLPEIRLSVAKPAGNPGLEDLAHQLAARGVSSLRYDRRVDPVSGSGPQGLPSPSQLIGDAIAALQYRKQRLGSNSDTAFLCAAGTSAILAPYIVEKYQRLAGLVLINPSVLPIERILAEQKRQELEQQGKTEPEIRQELASQNQMFADIRAGKTPATRLIEGAPAAYWLDWMNRNPAEELGKLNLPILVLQAGRDETATDANSEKLQKALGTRGPAVEFRLFPNMNHSHPRFINFV